MARAIALLSLLALAAPPSSARAQDGDTVYGRLDGDLTLSAAIGGGVAFGDRGGPEVTGTTTLELRARLLDTGGLVIAPEWRPEGDSRVIVAIDLRPIFLMRFLSNLESGDRYLDLFVDSIGIDLGAAITPLDADVGVAFAFGWGLDIPMFVPSGESTGLFFRLSGRWVSALGSDQLGPVDGTNDVVVLGLIVVRGVTSLGIGRWEPPRYRMPEDDE